MNTRRQFSKSLALLAGTGLLARAGGAAAVRKADDGWLMPDEGVAHARTWMAFGAQREIWGSRLLPEVQRNLALVARSIARFEPVSMLVRDADYNTARGLVGAEIELIRCPLDDAWIRDTGPVFVLGAEGQKAAVDFNFNGWGEKQEYEHDAQVAAFVAHRVDVLRKVSTLVLEGGGIEVDGQGTALISASCVLNENRNPGVSRSACETELHRVLGVEKIIWLPGIKGMDITDGHTDFYARFTSPGVVVAAYDPDPESFDHAVTKAHLDILRRATDAQGRKLEVVVLTAPATVRAAYDDDDFAAGYINFYVCNGAVIAPEFGDKKADSAAKETLGRLFPGREMVQINVDAIAAGGGGIHCVTQQEPLV